MTWRHLCYKWNLFGENTDYVWVHDGIKLGSMRCTTEPILKKIKKKQLSLKWNETLLLVVLLCLLCSRSVLLNKVCLFLKVLSLQNFEIRTTDIAGFSVLFAL